MGNRAGSQRLIQLGERIRQKRKDSHLSQETFAEKADISVKHSEPDRGRAGGDVRGDFRKSWWKSWTRTLMNLLGRRAKEKENDPVETTAAVSGG